MHIWIFVGLAVSSTLSFPVTDEWSKRARMRTLVGNLTDSHGMEVSDRIPRVVEVINYDLTIEPFFPYEGFSREKRDAFTLDASLIITFKVTKQTSYVHLRSENLQLDSLWLTLNGQIIPVSAFNVDPKTSNVMLAAVSPFRVGSVYKIELKYTAPIDAVFGLYYDSYEDDGKKKYALATAFEPADARMMMPCFDDPWFKAVFELSIIHPNSLTALSNMGVKETRDWNRYKTITVFHPTPKMSTYLLTLAVGEFREARTTSKSGIDVGFQGLGQYAHSVGYWADVGAKCVDAMEDLTGVRYPLAKLDNVDMRSMGYGGAIENWGMIVYGGLLNKHPKWTTSIGLEGGVTVICHETAHQWFGDLVTADHWGLEFLHESFAYFFQHRALQQFAEDTSLLEGNFARREGLFAARYLNHPVVTNQSQFDGVTYRAGGDILRMLNYALGDKVFKSALKIYLEGNAFGNADHLILIRAFEEALDYKPICGQLTIREVMLDFLTQSHYPYVYVDVLDNPARLEIKQHSTVKEDEVTGWNVPLFVLEPATQTSHLIWLQKDGDLCSKSPLPLDPTKTYIFQQFAASFHRVHYSTGYWDRLLKTDFHKVDELTAIAMFDDQREFESVYREEAKKEYSQKVLAKIVEDTEGRTHPYLASSYFFLSKKKDDVIEKIVDSVNFATTNPRDVLFARFAGNYGVQRNIGKIREKAVTAFRGLMNSCRLLKDLDQCNKLKTDVRGIVYCAAMMGSPKEPAEFLRKYRAAVAKLSSEVVDYELELIDDAIDCADGIVPDKLLKQESNFSDLWLQ